MIILLHTSKTMRYSSDGNTPLRTPELLKKAQKLDAYLKTLSTTQLQKIMNISASLAEKTYALIAQWTINPGQQSLAIDSFRGDIYSGLQAQSLSPADRDYADENLFILSGLYGIIRPYDGICPYRLEMEYKLPDPTFSNLYKYWGDSIAACLPSKGPIVNLTSEEYSKSFKPFIDELRIVSPKFLTINPKTKEPSFVVVHAKIARGACARWLITHRINDIMELKQFDDLSYRFNQKLSTPTSPTFVCENFGGKGLSMRLK